MSFTHPVNDNANDNDNSANDTDTPRPGGRRHKLDGAQWRDEITARTAAGESCRQVCDALVAQGFNVSHQTISRWRVDWGLRQRAVPRTKGRALATPRPRKSDYGRGKGRGVDKEQLAQLTREGRPAEEIAEIFRGQGLVLKLGASSIWRLQTTWKLVAYDEGRARGTGKWKKGVPTSGGAEVGGEKRKRGKKGKKGKKGVDADAGVGAASAEDAALLHYPSNCSFGPQKRALCTRPDAGLGAHTAMGDEADAGGSDDDMQDDDGFAPQYEDDLPSSPFQRPIDPQLRNTTYDRPPPSHTDHAAASSADLMSAELLVDLANSALLAAMKHKDLVLAVQLQRPVASSMSASLPSAQDLADARRKVSEATSVVMDLVGG